MFKSVKSQKVYNPQSYLEFMTGSCYFLKNDKHPVEEIQDILRQNGIEAWDYPLDEIDHCIETEIPVVLVDVSHYEEGVYVKEFRWFEVPKDFEED